jgi:hypothetical protein
VTQLHLDTQIEAGSLIILFLFLVLPASTTKLLVKIRNQARHRHDILSSLPLALADLKYMIGMDENSGY